MDCSEDYSGNHYNRCDASLYYEMSTDYSGGAYLDVVVECIADIEYKTRLSGARTDSSSDSKSFSIYAHGAETDSFDASFSFGAYEEVYYVQISDARCEVKDVQLW